MNTQELLTAYHKVDRLPRMETGEVAMETKRVADHDEVIRQLKAFAPTCGWLGFQSENRLFTDGLLPESDENTGLLLAAECYNTNENTSLHIRQDGAGGWLLTYFEMRAGKGSFFDTVKFVAADSNATDTKLGWLRYRRYWQIDAEHGAEPFAACFIGFGEE